MLPTPRSTKKQGAVSAPWPGHLCAGPSDVKSAGPEGIACSARPKRDHEQLVDPHRTSEKVFDWYIVLILEYMYLRTNFGVSSTLICTIAKTCSCNMCLCEAR